ncbi:hypothetical protein [Rubrivirga sp. SAORIC476]|uniref:hypothetical protein n=1 Tax=Rubrivirga sp. SAORIC476 TaxID=1961794 RepID=UPI00117A2396|nr:hypothetical protein [Rubrivirga sp. SAORIC476]
MAQPKQRTVRSLIEELEERVADGRSTNDDPVLVRVNYGSEFVKHVQENVDKGSVDFVYPALRGGLNNLFIELDDPWSEDRAAE